MPADVLVVSLGTTAGLRAMEEQLAGSLRRAGASVAVARARPAPEVRTFALTDLLQAREAARAARRAVVYSSSTAALLWPRPGAIHFDAPAAANRPGRHGIWQRPLERRRFAQAPLVAAWSPGGLAEAPSHREGLVVPFAVEPSGPPSGRRDIAALTYAADPHKKGLDRVLDGWRRARRPGETLVVTGRVSGPRLDGVEWAPLATPTEFRAHLHSSPRKSNAA